MSKKSRTASLPVSAATLNRLLDHLDERLTEDECDHTHRFTEVFLARAAGDDADEVLAWLVEHGGVCDCEAMASLEDELRG